MKKLSINKNQELKGGLPTFAWYLAIGAAALIVAGIESCRNKGSKPPAQKQTP